MIDSILSTNSERLDAVIAKLGKVRRAGAGFLARCPAHDDRQASLSVKLGDDGKVLLNCHAGCQFEAITSALKMAPHELFVNHGSRQASSYDEGASNEQLFGDLTLREFSESKKLPLERLRALGVGDGEHRGRRCVEFAYPRLGGGFGRLRLRLAMSGDRFRWRNREGEIVAYTPDRCELSRQEHYTVIVEGESCTLSHLVSGIPAIGIPGANMATKLETGHLEQLSCVFVVQEPDTGGSAFAAGVQARLRQLDFSGDVHLLRMPPGVKDSSSLYVRNPVAFEQTFRDLMNRAKLPATPEPRSRFEWRDTAEIFAPLAPTKWIVEGLQLAPGRPAMLGGYGASAKTLATQSLCLAVASGTPAWGQFPTVLGHVRHLDYEQGWNATARRYQRLAIGHGIERDELGDRLNVAIFPRVYLDAPDAVDAYASACDGASLVVLDALRGATPSLDENDSKIRVCLDNLARVSEKTGTAFWILHHAGKPKEGHSDPRTILRGSSAIFDACGGILIATTGKNRDDPRKVSQIKSPAEAEGGPIEDFALAVEDVRVGANPVAGVRVIYRSFDVKAPPTADTSGKYDSESERLLAAIRREPGITHNVLIGKTSMNRSRAGQLLAALEDEGRVQVLRGARGSKSFRVPP